MIDFEDPQEVVEQRLRNARKRRFQFTFFVVAFSFIMGMVFLLDYDVITRLSPGRGTSKGYYTFYMASCIIGIPAYLAARYFATKRYGNDDDVV